MLDWSRINEVSSSYGLLVVRLALLLYALDFMHRGRRRTWPCLLHAWHAFNLPSGKKLPALRSYDAKLADLPWKVGNHINDGFSSSAS